MTFSNFRTSSSMLKATMTKELSIRDFTKG